MSSEREHLESTRSSDGVGAVAEVATRMASEAMDGLRSGSIVPGLGSRDLPVSTLPSLSIVEGGCDASDIFGLGGARRAAGMVLEHVTERAVEKVAERVIGAVADRALTGILGEIPDSVMSPAQKGQLKDLLLHSNVDVDPSSGDIHTSRADETKFGPITVGKDASFKIGSGFPPALEDVRGVQVDTPYGKADLNRLELTFDESGNPMVKTDLSKFGIHTSPTVPLRDILSSH